MTEKCKHCGNIHEFRCPLIKSIEYFEDGTIKRVEYMTPADYATIPAYVPYPVLQPYPVPVYQYPYHRPVYPQPVTPLYPITVWGNTSSQLNTIGGSHSTLYNY